MTATEDHLEALQVAEARIAELEKEREEWFGVWPQWAADIRATLIGFGVDTDDDAAGCDLPAAFADWAAGFGDEYDAWKARALLAEPELARTRAALNSLLIHYVELANSGDAGFWDPETEAVVIEARATLSPTLTQHDSQGEA